VHFDSVDWGGTSYSFSEEGIMKRPLLYCTLALTSSFLIAAGASADVRLPAVIGDNMVVQQGMQAHIWGWADPGEPVRVRGDWQTAEVRATADEEGMWLVELDTPEAGGPHSILIEGKNAIDIKNVMAGEVWICSGQSNMQMSIAPSAPWHKGALNFQEEIAAARYPDIRHFAVAQSIAGEPQNDCAGSWVQCSPETVADFSATAYFFGRALHTELGVPIGLIHTSWGGTRAEAWTSRETLVSLGDYQSDLEETFLARTPENIRLYEEAESALSKVRTRMDAENRGAVKGYAEPDYDDTSWELMELPATLENAGDDMQIDGVVWFRKEVVLPEAWAGRNMDLKLGPVDDCDTTYFNGVKLGSIGYGTAGSYIENREYVVPGTFVTAGRNIVAVRVFDHGGGGGINGTPDQLTLSPAGAEQDPISLAGPWRYKVESVLEPNPVKLANSNSATVLYNAMIAPLLPYRIRGAIWYQGESNHTEAYRYRRLFPAMIQNWRDDWGQGDFPFYYVQIAPFLYAEPVTAAELREAQLMTLSVPNTGMAVTSDISEIDDIHPRNKQDVGKRLALWALAKTYGKKIVYSGPVYKSMDVEGSTVRLHFDHVGGGLVARDGDLTDFTIAGADRVFVDAKAVIDGDTILVSSPHVDAPVAVRFGWTNTAAPNLFNKEGLPASTFRTDDWPGVTYRID